MIEARKFSCDDQGYVDLRLRRSFDDGKTWGSSLLVHGNSTETEWTTVGDASMVEDRTTGLIWLIHTRNNTFVFVSSSSDQGETWSEPINITAQCKYGYPAQGWIGTGHAGGIQLESGRLIVPTYTSTSYILYSDDHGKSWHIGGAVTGKYAGGHENQVAEMDNGTLIMSMRGTSFRLQAYSPNGGTTWDNVMEVKQLPEPIAGCEGSIVYHPGTKKLYFSHPDPVLHLFRTKLAVWSSSDHGQTWKLQTVVWPKGAGYSAMVVMGKGAEAKLGLLYERNNHTMVVFEAQSESFTTVDLEPSFGTTFVI
jgi:sialidase-1